MTELTSKSDYALSLYSDAKMEAARALGVAFQVDEKTDKALKGYGIDLVAASGEEHRWLPVPAVFIVGADRVVTFQYVDPNYSRRIDPSVLIAAARAAAP